MLDALSRRLPSQDVMDFFEQLGEVIGPIGSRNVELTLSRPPVGSHDVI